MAVITPTVSKSIGQSGGIEAVIFTWATLANGDTGKPVQIPDYVDRSIQIEGTFGAGGSGTIQGSNDGSNFRALSNPAGTTIAITSAGVQQVTEATLLIQPAITAGDGTTALTCTVICRRTLR